MTKIRFDTIRLYPKLQKALKKANRGKTDALGEIFAEHRKAPWEERNQYRGLVSEDLSIPALDTWCRYDPTSPDAWLLRGCRRTHWAWEARGGGGAETVTQEGWRLFGQRLHGAEADLLWSAELLPEDPTPLCSLITVAMGLSQGRDRIRELFAAAIERDPESAAAYHRATYALTEKWSGSHDEMFAIARQAADLARPHNDLATVLIDAHIERWLYYKAFAEDKEGAMRYLNTNDVRQEVTLLFDRTMKSSAYSSRPSTRDTYNTAAFWFFLTRDKKRLAFCFDKMDGAFLEAPWQYYANPATTIGEALKMARR